MKRVTTALAVIPLVLLLSFCSGVGRPRSEGPIAYRAIALDAELYGSVEALQPSCDAGPLLRRRDLRLRNRDALSVVFSSREENWLREVDSNHYRTR